MDNNNNNPTNSRFKNACKCCSCVCCGLYWLFWVLIIGFVLAAIGGALYYGLLSGGSDENEPNSTEALVASTTPDTILQAAFINFGAPVENTTTKTVPTETSEALKLAEDFDTETKSSADNDVIILNSTASISDPILIESVNEIVRLNSSNIENGDFDREILALADRIDDVSDAPDGFNQDFDAEDVAPNNTTESDAPPELGALQRQQSQELLELAQSLTQAINNTTDNNNNNTNKNDDASKNFGSDFDIESGKDTLDTLNTKGGDADDNNNVDIDADDVFGLLAKAFDNGKKQAELARKAATSTTETTLITSTTSTTSTTPTTPTTPTLPSSTQLSQDTGEPELGALSVQHDTPAIAHFTQMPVAPSKN